MLRITYEVSQPFNVLHVEGRLKRENLAELENAVSAQSGAICLDLKNLIYSDEEGISLIRTIAADGAELRNVSPLIRMLLEQVNGE